MKNKTRSETSVDAFESAKAHRRALMNTNDINHILVHGAEISYSKLRRGSSHSARIFYFAEIGVYLEVSLSSGSGVTNDSRARLSEIHQKALITLMDANKKENASQK